MKKILLILGLFTLASCTNNTQTPVDAIPDPVPVVEQVDSTPPPPPVVARPDALIKGKVNESEWEGKSMMNPPPYYKFGSRMMQSPDVPILKMSFGNNSDNSSVSFDLKGGLKPGIYTKETLEINYSNNTGTNVYEKESANSTVTVEVTEYNELGNTATISGRITGTIQTEEKGTTTLDLEWKNIEISVWGEEAK